jgi:hypothetical protein
MSISEIIEEVGLDGSLVTDPEFAQRYISDRGRPRTLRSAKSALNSGFIRRAAAPLHGGPDRGDAGGRTQSRRAHGDLRYVTRPEARRPAAMPLCGRAAPDGTNRLLPPRAFGDRQLVACHFPLRYRIVLSSRSIG